jgi:hypothetical protein
MRRKSFLPSAALDPVNPTSRYSFDAIPLSALPTDQIQVTRSPLSYVEVPRILARIPEVGPCWYRRWGNGLG